ncbi:neuronal acetylcholine receptor subunit alpha-9-like [Liolophura sinensis]|uniref:neuronal acetylcholine receptor subunit alpha-9-like n=1 Tax=Liolophura sinensis TaxID=3198878 RepID=UPI0031585740
MWEAAQRTFLTAVCAALWAGAVGFGSFTMEQKLKDYLFPDDFDPTVRPVADVNDNVTVYIDISLNHLVDLNEKIQVLQSEIWVRLTWYDPQLRWNRSDFGNVSSIHVAADMIWKPDIVLYNEVGLETGKDPMDFLIAASYDGTVRWLYPRTIETSCKMDVSEFPYDFQKCIFVFGSWAFTGNLLDVRNKSSRGDTSSYVDNGEWRLVMIEVIRHELMYPCCDHPFPDVTFTMVLQRRSLYYIYNIIIPCILITMLHLTTFLLPAESGEKISLNVTILLGLTVFLLLVAEIMPPQSQVIPIVGQYFGVCICIVSLSTALGVFILHLHFRGSRGFPLPRWVRSLIIGKLGHILFYGNLIEKTLRLQTEKRSRKKPARLMEKNSTDHSSNGTEVELVSVHPDRANDNVPNGHVTEKSEAVEGEEHAIKTMYRHDHYVLNTEGKPPMEDLGVLHRRIEDKEEEEKAIIQDWILVSLILDRFFFIICAIVDVAAILFVLCRNPVYHADT